MPWPLNVGVYRRGGVIQITSRCRGELVVELSSIPAADQADLAGDDPIRKGVPAKRSSGICLRIHEIEKAIVILSVRPIRQRPNDASVLRLKSTDDSV